MIRVLRFSVAFTRLTVNDVFLLTVKSGHIYYSKQDECVCFFNSTITIQKKSYTWRRIYATTDIQPFEYSDTSANEDN